jgi:hypothetical protein
MTQLFAVHRREELLTGLSRRSRRDDLTAVDQVQDRLSRAAFYTSLCRSEGREAAVLQKDEAFQVVAGRFEIQGKGASYAFIIGRSQVGSISELDRSAAAMDEVF